MGRMRPERHASGPGGQSVARWARRGESVAAVTRRRRPPGCTTSGYFSAIAGSVTVRSGATDTGPLLELPVVIAG